MKGPYQSNAAEPGGWRAGIVYIVNGLGGGARYTLGRPIKGSAFRYNADWGALRVTATTTSLNLAFYRVGADRSPVDRYRLDDIIPVQGTIVYQTGMR